MARYTGARLRVTRRLGDLPGLTSKKGNKTDLLLSRSCYEYVSCPKNLFRDTILKF